MPAKQRRQRSEQAFSRIKIFRFFTEKIKSCREKALRHPTRNVLLVKKDILFISNMLYLIHSTERAMYTMSTKWDSIIFDLDGTLWDAVTNITEIWNEGIRRESDVSAMLTEDDVRKIMGLNTKEIGDALFPSLPESRRWELMLLCGKAESNLLPQKGGILYPELENTLKQLKKRIPLFIVSNCDQGYIEAFLSYHQLAEYFTDFLCYGDTGKDKPENIKTMVAKHKLCSPVYLGDTEKDRQSAAAAGVDFIHAAYGYGTLKKKEKAIRSLPELLDLFELR